MKIIIDENGNHILVKNNTDEINVNNSSTVEYTGVYYQNVANSLEPKKIEKQFIGIIESVTCVENDIIGLHIKPLYINNNDEWYKIIKCSDNNVKSFIYPHLLLLSIPNSCFNPLYFLETLENRNLDNYSSTTKTFSLIFLQG